MKAKLTKVTIKAASEKEAWEKLIELVGAKAADAKLVRRSK